MNAIDRQELLHRLDGANLIKNNGRVLRTLTILQGSYQKLTGIQGVLENDGISKGEFLESVQFLSEDGYLHLRDISTKESVMLVDSAYSCLEAKITTKGTRLLSGKAKDDMIEV